MLELKLSPHKLGISNYNGLKMKIEPSFTMRPDVYSTKDHITVGFMPEIMEHIPEEFILGQKNSDGEIIPFGIAKNYLISRCQRKFKFGFLKNNKFCKIKQNDKIYYIDFQNLVRKNEETVYQFFIEERNDEPFIYEYDCFNCVPQHHITIKGKFVDFKTLKDRVYLIEEDFNTLEITTICPNCQDKKTRGFKRKNNVYYPNTGN